MTGKIGSIQALRALAISAVFIYHLKTEWLPNGFLGVDIFFAISGYLMTQILSKSTVNCTSISTFFNRRVKRIVPLYLITILSALLFGRELLASKDLRVLNADSLWSLTLLSNMQSAFHQYDYFEEMSSYKLLVHTWSLSVELQYYLVVPLLMFLMLRMSRKSRIVAASVLVAISWASNRMFDPTISFGLLPCRIWQFLVGFLAFQIRNEELRVIQKEEEEETCAPSEYTKPLSDSATFHCNPFTPILSYSLFIALVISCATSSGNVELDRSMTTLLTGILLFFSANGSPVPLLSLRPFVYLGDISYVFYLAHWPVIVFLKYISDETVISPRNLLLALLITTFISVVVHHTIEQHKFSLFTIGGLYTACFLVALLPVQALTDVPGLTTAAHNFSKDCGALAVAMHWPKMENYREYCGFGCKYGELSGNGTFDVLVMGNSFVFYGLPWFLKAFNGRYRRLYADTQNSCLPFINYAKITDDRVPNRCKNAFDEKFDIVKSVKPKIIFMSLGYDNTLIYPKEDLNEKGEDRIVLNAVEGLLKFSEYTDQIIIDYPPMQIDKDLASRFQKAVEKHTPIPKRNESQYTIQDYLEKFKLALPRFDKIRRSCPKCRFVELQSSFCDGNKCDPFDYDCSQPIYFNDGYHLLPFALNLLYPKYETAIDLAVFLAQREK